MQAACVLHARALSPQRTDQHPVATRNRRRSQQSAAFKIAKSRVFMPPAG
jgi:hypothetical protein